MTVINVISKRGGGKSLFGRIYASLFEQVEGIDKNIFSTYSMKGLKSFHLIRLGVIRYSEIAKLKTALLVFDDIKALKNIDQFLTIVANISRKNNFDIILTGQYYTYLSREGRFLCDYEAHVEYDKDACILHVQMIDLDNEIFEFTIEHCNKFYDLYDTNEIVEIATERKLYDYILNFCDDLDDVELNFATVFNKTTATRLMKKVVKEPKFMEI